jgi:protein-tyrosine phosphatase
MLGELLIDSAGTRPAYLGAPPDSRALRAASDRGYEIPRRLRARKVVAKDFERFDWILAMDERNLGVLATLRPLTYGGHLGLFMDLVPGTPDREIPDPYFGGAAHFARVFELVELASAALLEEIAGSRADELG